MRELLWGAPGSGSLVVPSAGEPSASIPRAFMVASRTPHLWCWPQGILTLSRNETVHGNLDGHPSEIVASSPEKCTLTGRIKSILSRSRTRTGVSARIATRYLHLWEDCRAMPLKSSRETPYLIGQETVAFGGQSTEVGWA